MTSPATLRLVDPTGGEPAASGFALAPRPATLRGKRVALLDNSKANSEPILRGIARLLDEDEPFGDLVYLTKHSASLPPRPEILEELHRRADLVITGVGD